MGPDASTCVGTSQTCPSDHACGAVRTVTQLGENKVDIYVISCVPVKECNSPGSISVPNGKIRRGISCCYTSNCTPPEPRLPADVKEANGLVCGTCLTESSTFCSAEEVMECTGKEDMCLFQTSVTTGIISTQEALRGCSTKTYCDLGEQSVKSAQMSIELTYSCTPGENQTKIAPTELDNVGNSHNGHSPSTTLICFFLLLLLCSKW
ncbi:phospholipase A2 inhibitor and Ly6/PLAUR domain-containing protein-like isoform X2 [Pyxicephalus adspersus]